MLDYVTGRKIVAAAVLLTVAVVVTYFKGDIPRNLESFMEIIYGTFVVGNGVEYFSKLKLNTGSEKSE